MPHVLPSCAWLLPYAWALILLPLLAQCIYRCCVERRQPPAQPSPGVGWASHAAAVAAVHTSFLHFLSTRSPGQLLSLRRSREGHYASNRTMEATYKESSGTLDVSELDGVIALDAATGAERWRKSRDERSSWSTPLVVEVGGKLQAIVAA